jgi:Sec7-like guanine-nucleotide exchange factor
MSAHLLKGLQKDFKEILPYSVQVCGLLLQGFCVIQYGGDKQEKVLAPTYFEGPCLIRELSADSVVLPLDSVEQYRSCLTAAAERFLDCSRRSPENYVRSGVSCSSIARHSIAITARPSLFTSAVACKEADAKRNEYIEVDMNEPSRSTLTSLTRPDRIDSSLERMPTNIIGRKNTFR